MIIIPVSFLILELVVKMLGYHLRHSEWGISGDIMGTTAAF